MSVKLRASFAALLLTASTGLAVAQTVVIQPEQEVVIREYVKKKPMASISLPGVELNLGSRVPDEVELYTIDQPDVTYRYVVVDGRTVLVNPETREIVRVLD